MWLSILCRTPEELAKTDIAEYALEALSQSKVKEVYILGRRKLTARPPLPTRK